MKNQTDRMKRLISFANPCPDPEMQKLLVRLFERNLVEPHELVFINKENKNQKS